MKKFFNIALAMAAFAVVGWSCEDDQKITPVEADNSYVLSNEATPIVWAGFETIEDVYSIYLAEATPASTTSPITIDGLTINIPVEVLGVEHVIGTAGVEASLNGTALTGGTLLVTKTDTELVVDIKDSKVGEDDFSANWEGAFTIVEPEVVEPEDNYYIYDGERTELAAVYNYGRETGIGYDGYYIVFTDRALATGDDLFEKAVYFYVPVARMGQDIELVYEEIDDFWEVEFEYWDGNTQVAHYAGYGYEPGDIAGGYFNSTIDGNDIVLTGEIEFVDGKTMEINFDGAFTAFPGADDGGGDEEPEMPEYDETLNNQWQYNGGAKMSVNYADFELTSGQTWDGIYFTLSDEEPVYDAVEDMYYLDNAVIMYSPTAKLGTEILLQTDPDEDYWEVQFWNEEVDYGDYGYEPFFISNGKMIVSKSGMNINVKLAVLFFDGTILRAKYSGPAVEFAPPMMTSKRHPMAFMKSKVSDRQAVKSLSNRTMRFRR